MTLTLLIGVVDMNIFRCMRRKESRGMKYETR